MNKRYGFTTGMYSMFFICLLVFFCVWSDVFVCLPVSLTSIILVLLGKFVLWTLIAHQFW